MIDFLASNSNDIVDMGSATGIKCVYEILVKSGTTLTLKSTQESFRYPFVASGLYNPVCIQLTPPLGEGHGPMCVVDDEARRSSKELPTDRPRELG